MISITTRAAKMLREKLARLYMEAGGLDTLSISPEVAGRLKEKLLERCFEAGIGFRMLVVGGECGETAFSMQVDKACEGDLVLETDGIKVFVDRVSAARADDHQLDYVDEAWGSFILR